MPRKPKQSLAEVVAGMPDVAESVEAPKPARMGRPTLKTPEMVKRICDLLIEGNNLAAVCRMEGMPAYGTVVRWEDEDADFRAISLRACARGTDFIADDTLRIADDTEIDPQHKKIMIDTRLRLIGKWNQKKYGDKTQTELTGPDGGPIDLRANHSDAELLARATQLMASLPKPETAP